MLFYVCLKVNQALVVIQLEKTGLEILLGGPGLQGFFISSVHENC